jgi:hypothetical protein
MFAASSLLAEPQATARAVATPELVAEQAMLAMRQGDYRGFAQLLHPDARRDLKTAFRFIAQSEAEQYGAAAVDGGPEGGPSGDAAEAEEGSAADGLPQEVFGIRSLEEYDAMDSAVVVEKVFGFLEQQVPGLRAMLSGASGVVIGSVPEGEDVHLVQRTTVQLNGRDITQMEVITLRRFEGQWRMLLKAEMAAMFAAMGEPTGN